MRSKAMKAIRWTLSIPVSVLAMGFSYHIYSLFLASILMTDPQEFLLFIKFFPAVVSGMTVIIVGNLISPSEKKTNLSIVFCVFLGMNFLASLALNDLSVYLSYDAIARCFGQFLGGAIITYYVMRD